VKELVAMAKAKPGGMNFASGGNGSSPHLSGELFNIVAGTRITHIPYKGSGPGVTDLLGGHVQMMFAGPLALEQHIKSGRLRPLALADKRRSTILPDVPTMAEAGVTGQESETMQGILVPAGTPKEIVDLLNREIVKAMALPDVKEKCAQLGFDPIANKPDEFAAYIKKEVEKWGKVIKDANIPQIQ
jgi:tripartite-type tricarboxylate transporter receptor subunit TctC